MNRKILVAYFSASGVTAKVAEKLAGAVWVKQTQSFSRVVPCCADGW